MTHLMNRGTPTCGHVCQCDFDWLDEDLEEFADEDFEEDCCSMCGGRVVIPAPPTWMIEEEDDC
jgi:hypothetical protein